MVKHRTRTIDGLSIFYREAGPKDAPTVVRFPKGPVCADIPAVATVDGLDVLVQAVDRDVLLVSVGAMAETCLEVAQRCARRGFMRTECPISHGAARVFRL